MLPLSTKIQMFIKVKAAKEPLNDAEINKITNLLMNTCDNDINIISEFKNFTDQVMSMTILQQNAKARMKFLENKSNSSDHGHGHSHDGHGHSHNH